jgi:hypothetical protein
MNVCSAFGLAPASINSEAKVCLHSCSVIGRSLSAAQRSWAWLRIVEG